MVRRKPTKKGRPKGSSRTNTINEQLTEEVSDNFILPESSATTLADRISDLGSTNGESQGSCTTAAGNSVDNAPECDKCGRMSTQMYPLQLITVKKADCFARRYGLKLTEVENHVCSLCHRFLDKQTSTGNDFKHAWPSVIMTYLKDTSLVSKIKDILPESITLSWINSKRVPNESRALLRTSKSAFKDYTQRLKKFNTSIDSLKAAKLISILNEESFPDVRCFCGASEFLEKCGRVQFHHLIQFLDCNFCGFDANSQHFLLGIVPDYFQQKTILDVFETGPGLVVDTDGLSVLTCQRHSKGSTKQIIAFPEHPTLDIISPNQPDRMSRVSFQPRTVKSGKVGRYSSSSRLINYQTGYAGCHSGVLTENVNWSAKCEKLAKSEALAFSERPDVGQKISELERKGQIDQKFINNLRSVELPDPQTISKCVSTGTVVLFEDAVEMRRCQMGNENFESDIKTYPGPIYSHNADEYGAKPYRLSCSSQHKILRLIQALYVANPTLFRKLKVVSNPVNDFVANFIKKSFTNLTKKNKFTIAEKQKTQNDLLRLVKSDSLQDVLFMEHFLNECHAKTMKCAHLLKDNDLQQSFDTTNLDCFYVRFQRNRRRNSTEDTLNNLTLSTEIKCKDRHFSLRFLLVSGSPNLVFVRHAHPFTGWWVANENTGLFCQISEHHLHTSIDKQFNTSIDSLKAAKLISILNEESFPDVRCFCGASEFLEKCGRVQFHHLIQFLDCNFCGFDANSQHFLLGIVPDYFQQKTILDVFETGPGLVVDTDGLSVLTCQRHSKGSTKQIIAFPEHPTLDIISPNQPDRMSRVSFQPRTVKSGKVGRYSSSSRLINYQTGYAGCHSGVLTENVNWSAKCEKLAKSEALAFSERPDVGQKISELERKGQIDQKFINNLRSVELPDPQTISKCVSTGTVVLFEDAVEMRRCQMGNENFESDIKTYPGPIYSHNADEYGAKPYRLSCSSQHKILRLIQALYVANPTLFRKLKVVSNPVNDFVANFIKKSFTNLTKKNKFTIAEKQKTQNDLLRLVKSDSLQDVLFMEHFLNECHAKTMKCAHLLKDNDLQQSFDTTNLDCFYVRFQRNRRRNSTEDTLNNLTLSTEIKCKDRHFSLRFLLVSGSPNLVFVRHAHPFTGWWVANENTGLFCQISEHHLHTSFNQRNGIFGLYMPRESCELNNVKKDFLSFMGGQAEFRCNVHKHFLIQKPKKFNGECKHEKCRRKTKFKCPLPNCEVGICRKCCDLFSNKIEKFWPNSCDVDKEVDCFDADSDEDNFSDDEEENENLGPEGFANNEDEFYFDGDDTQQTENSNIEYSDYHMFLTDPGLSDEIDTEEDEINLLDETDCGVALNKIESSKAPERMPLHCLLNTHLRCFIRRGRQNSASLDQQHFFQYFVSMSETNSVPLLYPTAMLFSSLNWKQLPDGSFPGSIPAAFYQSKSWNKFVNFESLEDLLLNTVKDPFKLTSTDIYYSCFVFDCIMNKKLNYSHSYMVFRRGWEQTLNDLNYMRTPEAHLSFDMHDSRRNVHSLAAAIAEETNSFFTTLTCNMDEHFGVKPIYKAMRSYSETYRIAFNLVSENFMPYLVIAWQRVSMFLLSYIEKSPEQPLGPVEKLWARYEFQEREGNLPHIHFLAWTGESKDSLKLQQRVICSEQRLYDELRMQKYKDMGLITNEQDFQEAYELCLKIHKHNCEDAKFRCHKQAKEDGVSRCRHPRQPESANYFCEEVPVHHSEDCLEQLEKVNLAKYNVKTKQLEIDEVLKAGTWRYPCFDSETITPINAHLFLMTKSQHNCLICNEYQSSRYLTKYAAGVEEPIKGKFFAGKDNNQFNYDIGNIQNIKISSVKFRVEQEERKEKPNVSSRVLCTTECWWIIFEFPYVVSNFGVVNAQTTSLEFRASKLQSQQVSNHERLQAGGFLAEGHPAPFLARDNLPEWRKFHPSVKKLLQNVETDLPKIDALTVFGLRPPELYFIDNLRDYFMLFTRTQIISGNNLHSVSRHKEILHGDEFCLLDALGYQIKLRPKMVERFKNLCDVSEDHAADFFRSNEYCQEILNSMVDGDCRFHSVVVVYSTAYPENPVKFLIHILFSMGKFLNEIDLFKDGNLWKSFVSASLLQEDDRDWKKNFKNYVLQQGRFLPVPTRQFDRIVVRSAEVLESFITGEEFSYEDAPLHLIQSVREHVNEKCNSFLQDRRISIIQALDKSGKFEQFIKAISEGKEHEYTPQLEQVPHQCSDGYSRQVEALQLMLGIVNRYISGSISTNSCCVILGRPGTGKSLLTMFALTYCLSKKLTCMVSSLAAEKSAQYGGVHLHKLVPFPVKNKSLNPVHLASSAIAKLHNDPLKLVLLQNLDVLIFEEIGMLNAQLWSALDLVLKYVKDNKLPMGGIVFLGNGDPRQLPPPDGTLLWASSTVLATFKFFHLKHFVRMRDTVGQEVLTILDKPQNNDTEIDRLFQLMEDGGCNFPPDWSNIAGDSMILKVFGTRAAERSAVERFNALLSERGLPSSTLHALDETTLHGINKWKHSQKEAVKIYLNRSCLEPDSLTVYSGCFLRFTANSKELNVSQGQQCCVVSWEYEKRKIEVLIAPPGRRFLSDVLTDFDLLISLGWRRVTVSPITGISQIFSKQIAARRIQFPLKSFSACTIHKVIGDDVSRLATEITLSHDTKCWLREQVVVLISRVSQLSDLYLVGNKDATFSTIRCLLSRKSVWSDFIERFLIGIGEQTTHSSSFSFENHLYFPYYIELPSTVSPCVYLLVSVKRRFVFYIGKTCHLKNRLRQHNSGNGSSFTKDPTLRPWAILSAILGFEESNNTILSNAEFHWQSLVQKEISMGIEFTASQVQCYGEEIARKFSNEEYPLTCLHFGYVNVRQNNA